MRAACVVTLLTLAVVGALAALWPTLVERGFSTSIYPAIQQIITPMSNSVPIALFGLLCIAATILVAAVLIRAVRAAMRSRSAWRVARAVGYLALGAAAVYL